MNINSPFFSIIVPVYQARDWIRKTIINLQKQTFNSIEIILIDDGSTDGSAYICDNLAKEDKRIRVFHTPNKGVSSARNYGIKIAKGRWLIFVDSDDIVSSEMCQDFFNYIKLYPVLDFITCKLVYRLSDLINKSSKNNIVFEIFEYDQAEKLIKEMLLENYNELPGVFKDNFGNNSILNSPCGKTFKKSFLEKNSIFFRNEIKYSEDLLFNIEILATGAKGIFVNDAVYFYRENLASVTHQKAFTGFIKNYYDFKKIVGNVIKKNNMLSLKDALNVYTFQAALGVISSDIFNSKNTVKESYKSMLKITKSHDFLELCNLTILKEISKYLSFSTRIKANLLLKNKFLSLYILYKLRNLV